jgi:PIN domain nuclease of toxin-antitoxin system
MKYLLDTHTFLWMISYPDSLSKKAKSIIENSDNNLFLSSASGWEIVIKYQIGKLELPEEPVSYVIKQMKDNYIEDLPIIMAHSLYVHNLPEIHKDPFDRIIIAQSVIEKIPIISCDSIISKYNVEIVW